jgi:hypothetical protein
MIIYSKKIACQKLKFKEFKEFRNKFLIDGMIELK